MRFDRIPLRKISMVALALAALSGGAAAESRGGSPWQRVRTPAPGAPRSIGDYSAGCVQGAVALPLDGEGYQVMHPSRFRYFGHPSLIDFIEGLGRHAHARELQDVLIGDLSQPRGGRAPGGHASHQTGLDVDIWYYVPKQLGPTPLSSAQREQISARSVLDGKTESIQKRWAPRVLQLLELTARDERVQRVFVHPIIKRQACASTSDDRAWLGKLRPWFGHDDHFHVRLVCPDDSTDCTPQAKVAAGDGCGKELDDWFSEAAAEQRAQQHKRYQSKVISKPKLPALCLELL